jgi:hypothetical protein
MSRQIINQDAWNTLDEYQTKQGLQMGGNWPRELRAYSFEQLETWQTRDYTSLTFQQRQSNRCADGSLCLCHTLGRPIQRLQTSRFLGNLIGYLFMTYSGLSFLQPGCSSSSCRNYSIFSFHLTYRFPKWACAAAVRVTAGVTTFGDPIAALFIQRRVPETEGNGLMELVCKGDDNGIKVLLQKRAASPSDADSSYGHTALHVSFLSAIA